jgi:hypothetical protein
LAARSEAHGHAAQCANKVSDRWPAAANCCAVVVWLEQSLCRFNFNVPLSRLIRFPRGDNRETALTSSAFRSGASSRRGRSRALQLNTACSCGDEPTGAGTSCAEPGYGAFSGVGLLPLPRSSPRSARRSPRSGGRSRPSRRTCRGSHRLSRGRLSFPLRGPGTRARCREDTHSTDVSSRRHVAPLLAGPKQANPSQLPQELARKLRPLALFLVLEVDVGFSPRS